MKPVNRAMWIAVMALATVVACTGQAIVDEEIEEEMDLLVDELGLRKIGSKEVSCKKDPTICLTAGMAGPFCCRKKCVDLKTDRKNCGSCKRRCQRHKEKCCQGYCVSAETFCGIGAA